MTGRRVIASNVIGPTNLVAACGHDRDDVVAALLQPARDLDGLVGADPAGHAERDHIAMVECPDCRCVGLLDRRRVIPIERLYLPGDDFLLGDGGLLVVADGDAWRRPGQELAGAGPGGDDELEGVGKLGTVNHEMS